VHISVLLRRIFVSHVLRVVRQRDRGDGAFTQGDADRAVDKVAAPAGCRRVLDESARDVLEHADEIDFLLIAPPERIARLMAGDRPHWHMRRSRRLAVMR
jgi:hypothetical protein